MKVKSTLKKSISVVLAVLLLASAVPALAFAQSETPATTCEVAECTIEGCTGDHTSELAAQQAQTQTTTEEVATLEEEVAEEEVFTVRFFDWDKETYLGAFEVVKGEASPTPMPPSRDGYVFDKWDKDTSAITEDLTVYATYREMKTFTLAIEYVFTNGEAAAAPYIVSVEEGAAFNQSIPSPTVLGYTPNFATVDTTIDAMNEDAHYVVTYSLASGIPYTVVHHFETLDASDYENPITETFYGVTNDSIVAQANQYYGFTAVDGERTGVIAADGSLKIDIYYDRNEVALYFDSMGGSYIEPIMGRYGETIDYDKASYEDPKRAGYTFLNWDIDPLPTVFAGTDTTVKAQWDPNKEAQVTIVHWVENAATGGYDMASVDTSKVFETGTKPDFTQFVPEYSASTGYVGFPGNTGVNTPAKFNKYYPRNVEKTYQENYFLTVQPDGSTTYNIYYNLATLTYVFNYPGTVDNTSTSYKYQGSDVYLTINGKRYNSGEYTITCKYTENISSKWPLASQLGYTPGLTVEDDLLPKGWNYGSGTAFYNVYYTPSYRPASSLENGGMGDDMIMNMNLIVYPPGVSMSTIKIHYYSQNIGGGDDLEKDYSFEETEVLTGQTNNGTYISVPQGYTSYTILPGAEPSGVRWLVYYTDGAEFFAYAQRGQYSVVFEENNGTEAWRIDDIWYEDKVVNYLKDPNYTPKPSVNNSDLVFAGWYSSPKFEDNSKVNLSTLTMPYSELILYAKWEAPKYEVTFDLNGGTGQNATQHITSGGYITPYSEPSKPGYTFAGWFEKNSKVSFRFNSQVARDYALEARWTPNMTGEYTAYYRLEGTTTNLAAPATVTGLRLNSAQTATAKVINGYIPDAVSKSLTINSQSNAVFFYYKAFSSASYQVRYETMEGLTLLPSVTKVTSQALVTENHRPITGYYPLSAQLSLQISQNSLENVIVFKYIPYTHALYTVNHFQQNTDWSYSLAETEQLTAEINKYITVAPRGYANYNYNRSISNASGVVNAQGSLVLNMYYDLITHSITFSAEEGGSLDGTSTFNSILHGTNFSNAVTVPTPEAEEGYRFTGWSPALPSDDSKVEASATYTAQFEPTGTTGGTTGGGSTTPGITTPPQGEPEGPVENFLNQLNQLFSGEVPLASFDGSHWSLINLILSLICIIAAAVLLVRSFGRLKKDEDEKRTNTAEGASATSMQAGTPQQEEEEDRKRRFNFLRLVAMLVGIVPLILFIILEDMSLPMTLVDQFTILFALLTIAFVVVTGVQMMRNRQRAKDDVQEEDMQAGEQAPSSAV